MTSQEAVVISGAVEGLVDEAVLRRLVQHVGATPGPVYGKTGKRALQQRLGGYNQAARLRPWVVLVDLNDDAECAPPFRQAWLPNPAPYMCFRVAVRQVEAWLLADRDEVARFLGISAHQVPANSEALENAKQHLVELARGSRKREIREDIVPRAEGGRAVGPAYTSRLIEFVEGPWQPEIAAVSSDSLRRCVTRLREIMQGLA